MKYKIIFDDKFNSKPANYLEKCFESQIIFKEF